MSRSWRLIANISVYAIGPLSAQIVGFVMLPVITKQLDPDQFGVVEVVVSLLALAAPVVTLGIGEAVLRFGLDSRYSPRQVLANAVVIATGGYLISLLLWPLLALAEGIQPYLGAFYGVLAAFIVRDTAFQYLRSQNVLRPLLIGGVLQAVLLGTGLALFVISLDQGVTGYLNAMLFSGGLVGLGYSWRAWRELQRSSRNPTPGVVIQMLRYCLPLMPNGILWWAVSAASKLILLGVSSASAVGLYAVASRIVSSLSVATQVVTQGWQVSMIQERASDSRGSFQGQVFASLTGVLCGGAGLLLAFTKPIVAFLAAPDFFLAWRVMPPLVFGLVFMSMATFIGAEYRVQMATRGALVSSFGGALTSIVTAIPLAIALEAVGAAIAAGLGYLVMLAVRIGEFGLPSPDRRYPLVLLINVGLLLGQSASLYLNLAPAAERSVQAVAVTLLFFLNRRYVVHAFRQGWYALRARTKSDSPSI